MQDAAPDATEWLRAIIASTTGRILAIGDLWRELGLNSESTYYSQRREGTLLSWENMQTLASNLGINPVELFVMTELLDHEPVLEYCRDHPEPPSLPRRPNGLRGVQQPPEEGPPL